MTRLRRCTNADVSALEAFLMDHIATSMFPLMNLRRFGPEGGAHHRAMRYWCAEGPDGIVGILAHATTGTVMMQWPEAPDWGAAREVLDGQEIDGAMGASGQVRAVLAALTLADAPKRLDEDEELLALNLTDLLLPDAGGLNLVPLDRSFAEAMLPWRIDYQIGLLGTDPDEVEEIAARDIADWIEAGSHRVLIEGDQPVSMTGFNAALDDIVQIGGVYTPPELRGRGYARRAVALHLAEARENGARRAILFSSSDAALRAYAAIGFRHIGSYSLVFFDGKRRVI